jgi:hypothetical protein
MSVADWITEPGTQDRGVPRYIDERNPPHIGHPHTGFAVGGLFLV